MKAKQQVLFKWYLNATWGREMARNGNYLPSKGIGSQHNEAYGKHASENEKHVMHNKIVCVGGSAISPSGKGKLSLLIG